MEEQEAQPIEESADETGGGSSAPEGEKEKEPVQCIHEYTNLEFRREFREIFKGLAKKAAQGDVSATRLLLLIGKFGDAEAQQQHGGKSLGEMLLDELKHRQDEREAAQEVAKQGTAPEQAHATEMGEGNGGIAEKE